MSKIEEIIKEGVVGLIPIYKPEKGNCTQIITNEGNEYIDDRTLKTVLRVLCQYYTIQIEYCRKKYGALLHQRICVPILLHRELLLIPFKMRKPLFQKGGAYGYINYHTIESVHEGDDGTIVHLHNGVEIKCLQKIKSVQQYLTKAKVVANTVYEQQVLLDNPVEKEFFQQYSAPATRGDIASLQKEIYELVKVLKKVEDSR